MAAGNYKQVIAKVKRELPEKVDAALRELALYALALVVQKTPVDTGLARNSWQIVTDLSQVAPPPPGEYGQSGQANIARQTAAALALKGARRVYVASGVEYMIHLEYGHSQQAPSGMVRITAEEVRQAVPKFFADVFKGGVAVSFGGRLANG